MMVKKISVNAFWKGEIGVQGVIEDQKQTYKAKVFIKGSQVFDYSCSCANGNSHKGICTHCQALLNEFKRIETEENKIPVSTSEAVRLMIREYTNREVAKIVGEEGEPVRFIPKLLIRHNQVQMEARIGREKLYLLKDLSSFSQSVETGQYKEYGKRLAFHHSIGIFTKESRPFVRLTVELIVSYQEHYEQMKKGMMTAIPSFRTLPLNKAARDRFFKMAEGHEIEIEDGTGKSRVLKIERENPSFFIDVRKKGEEGIIISIPSELLAVTGEHTLYIADEKTLYCCDREYADALSVFMEQMTADSGSSHSVTVHKRDISLFYERVLKRLKKLGLLKEEGLMLEEYHADPLQIEFEFDSQNLNQISLMPSLSYGDFSFHPLEDENIPRNICRDIPEEFRVSCLITKYFKYREDGTKKLVIQDDEEGIYRLLNEGMSEFQELGNVYLSESFKNLKVLSPPDFSFGVSMNRGWLDLEVNCENISRTELSLILTEYKKKKKYFRMKSGTFLKLEDDGLLTVSRLSEELAIGKGGLFQSEKLSLPAYRAYYLDSIFQDNKGALFFRDQAFQHLIRNMGTIENSSYEIPASLRTILRGYQKTGFYWLKTLDENRFGGILADDMGLGKTIQMISLILSEVLLSESEKKQKIPSLIICPASLVYNWGHEFSLFAPELNVLLITGDFSERGESLEEMAQYDVVITSYDLLKRDLIHYQNKKFRYEVIDEAQYIKNASTQSAKAVKAVQSETRFALTGTPVENRLAELWSIFDYLMPGFLFSYRKFKTQFELPIVRDGDQKALSNLRKMIAPFVLRRLKKDVLKELPEKLEKVVYSAFEEKQKKLYEANAKRLKLALEGDEDQAEPGKIQILSELTRLRQICCDPSLCYEDYSGGSAKLDTCIDLVKGAAEAGHKILLFSQFASMLEIIRGRFDKEEISYYMLIGATPTEERSRLVDAFQKDDTAVFLISLKAGGTGLNLTAADMVIHYDPWWNAAVQNQATDRAYRIGQMHQVTVLKLIMEHTIEENMIKLQESKRNLADQIVTEGMVSLGALKKEELLEILGEI